MSDTGGAYLRVSFTRKTHAPGLSYVIEASSDLVTWTPVAVVQPGMPEAVVVRDSQPLAGLPRRFLRVRVDLAP